MFFKDLSPTQWKQQRQVYISICDLVQAVDKNFSPLLFSQVCTSVYFIVLQIFMVNMPKFSTYESLVYWYAMLSVVVRLVVIILMAFEVHNKSKAVLGRLYRIVSENYDHEAFLYLQIVLWNNVTVTGWNLFSIKRSLLLQVRTILYNFLLLN